jgi:molybdate/tungstate transport system substrate-binding protein
MTSSLLRRNFLLRGAVCAAALSAGLPVRMLAQALQELDVASAGSARAMLEGALKTAAAKTLHLDLHAHSEGADAVAKALVAGSLKADVFLPITATPMRTALAAGIAEQAIPVARTELVLVYSPKSRFAPQLAAAAEGKANWWEIVQQPGFRIGRGNPAADPGARAILFAMMLAGRKYNQPDLAEKVLGAPQNPAQLVPGVPDKLRSGEVDASASYKTGVGNGSLPFITLPEEINLSRDDVHSANPDVRLEIDGKTFYPDPLVFYAGALKNAANTAGAAAFLQWLQGAEAQALFQANGFAPPGKAPVLKA